MSIHYLEHIILVVVSCKAIKVYITSFINANYNILLLIIIDKSCFVKLNIQTITDVYRIQPF